MIMKQYYLEIPNEINQDFINEVSGALCCLLNKINGEMMRLENADPDLSDNDFVQFRGEFGKKIYDGLSKSVFKGFGYVIDYTVDLDTDEILILKNYNAIRIEELLNVTKNFGDGKMCQVNIKPMEESKVYTMRIKFKKVEKEITIQKLN